MALPDRHTFQRIARRGTKAAAGPRMLPEETPIAFTYNGTTHAVMMATPSNLEDFAYGFSLTEGIIEKVSDVEEVRMVELEEGVDLQIRLAKTAGQALTARRRHMAGPVGCGLCGIESIEQALRPAPSAGDNTITLSASEVPVAVGALAEAQPLHDATRTVHAAGFYSPREGLRMAREDVGRHNALDKLVGALLCAGINGAFGAVVITSRVSVEMVQKAAACGSGVVLAVSAPTALAVRTAEAAGMTLVASVRGDDYEIVTHPERIETGRKTDVA